MISVGINGFGRIGKAVFIQLIDNPSIQVTAINAIDFDVKHIERLEIRSSTFSETRMRPSWIGKSMESIMLSKRLAPI